ncbi:hypothetical protein [Candidatus Protochlamydia phocaeensis]|uniref:hypothetical protein n=1 Tax=Candidatus Protochlamydia phocaeensis TaxID=1414722 RepID=UPI0008381E23|nr:hypothetical protein [Candidatus Protochlamydia phocaeensis]
MHFILKIALLCLVFCGYEDLSASSGHDKFQALSQKKFKKYKSILANSTWIVPPSTLMAINYTAGTETALTDQTVWVISRFENGYFFGDAYVGINGIPTSHMKLVGSVTPFGEVYIAFYPAAGNLLTTDVVNGIGKLRRIQNEYVFIMQMNSAPTNLTGLAHWSYMISVDKEDYLYQNLPGMNISVPQFISLF